MIVDSSALVAILLREPGHERLLDALLAAPLVEVGAPTVVETGIVLTHRLGDRGRSLLARLLVEAEIGVVDFSARHADAALSAWHRYGRGRHPASLNYGDCLTYAVADVAARPLLCVGSDFPATDLELVVT